MKPISLRAVERRRHHVLAHLHVAHDVFEHHDRVIDDEADRERDRHQRQIVERVVERPHHRERPDDRHRQRQARDDRRGQIAQEQEDHHHDQKDGEQQRVLHVVDRRANRLGMIAQRVDMERGGHFRAKCGNQAHHVVDDFDGVGARLTLHREHHRALAVRPSRGLVVLHAVEHAPDILEPHRRSVLISDDQRAIRRRVGQLTLGIDGERLMRAVERAGRHIDVGVLDRRRDFVDADAARRKRLRIELNPHRVLLRSVNLHLRDAANHRDALGEVSLRVLIDLRNRHRVRAEPQVEDRLIGRINFAIRRRTRHPLRQFGLRLRDRRLHVLRAGVDIAREIELQRDVGPALDVRRGHRVEAGDRRELFLERRRDRRRHRLGTRAGQACVHDDRREIDVGQIVYRQVSIRHHAEQHDRERAQRRHDRPANKCFGDIHDAAPLSFRPLLIVTFAPGISLSCPSVTTVSPGLSPLVTTV